MAKEQKHYSYGAPGGTADLNGVDAKRNEIHGSHTKTKFRRGDACAGANVVGTISTNKDGLAAVNAGVASAGATVNLQAYHGLTSASANAKLLHAGAYAEAKGVKAGVGVEATVGKASVSLDVPVPLVSEHLTASASLDRQLEQELMLT